MDYAEPDRRWNKWLNVMHCITGPVFVVIAIKGKFILAVFTNVPDV